MALIKGVSLSGRVARRMLVLFLICSLVPVGMLGAFLALSVTLAPIAAAAALRITAA